MTESEYEMVMPFVTVTSKGGPHDDESYVAGYAMGVLDAQILVASTINATVTRDIPVSSRPQADLIAMRYGYVTDVKGTDEFPDWVVMTFKPGVTE